MEKEFNLIGQYDYTEYDMRGIASNYWSRCHITKGAITYDEYVYQVNSSYELENKGIMSFYWPESKHISQDAEVFELDGATERHAYERVKVEQMTDTISFVAVAREAKRRQFYECGTWFVIRPAHNSREFSIFAEERRYSTVGSSQGHIVELMEFSSNNSFLT